MTTPPKQPVPVTGDQCKVTVYPYSAGWDRLRAAQCPNAAVHDGLCLSHLRDRARLRQTGDRR